MKKNILLAMGLLLASYSFCYAASQKLISTSILTQSVFKVYLSEDQYDGNADASIAVDGKLVETGLVVRASKANNECQAFQFTGSYGAGNHVVSVVFLNDAYNGSSSTDRNLYFQYLTVDGKYFGQEQALESTGATANITVATKH
jgi:hypothetical protein